MLVLCLNKPNVSSHHPFDLYELRFDLFPFQSVPTDKKWILTLRRKKEGGALVVSENYRRNLIEELLMFKPDYLDLEHDVPVTFAQKIKRQYPKLKIIRSFHDLTKTPNLPSLFKKMQHPVFYAYKFACFAHSHLDALRMLSFIKNEKFACLSGMSLGPKGDITRILGPIAGNYMNYTSQEGIMGQVSIDVLYNTYHFYNLNHQTKVFALVGNPISQSVGHLFHNWFFQKNRINAVYVKIELKGEDLGGFFQLEKKFPLDGISVTTPLKSLMTPFIENNQAIVNTLIKQKGFWIGENTDGNGALKAIFEVNPSVKNALLIGAGATARAIYLEGKKRNIIFDVFNRSLARVQEFFPQNIRTFQDPKEVDFSYYDLIIQATSAEMFGSKLHFDFTTLKKGTLVLDVVRTNGLTRFLQEAKENGGICVSGNDLFCWQGYFQQNLWQKTVFPEDGIIEFRKRSW